MPCHRTAKPGGGIIDGELIVRQLTYLQSACEQYLHLSAAFYLTEEGTFAQAAQMWARLLEQRSENVALKSGIYTGQTEEKAGGEAFHIPQIAGWRRLLQEGYPLAMEREACQLLDKLASNDRLDRESLRHFYQDFMQMVFTMPENEQGRIQAMFREQGSLELYRNGMKTVDDMKALIHYVAASWPSEAHADGQNVVETVCRYVAEHLEEELRREDLAEAVHLNPDYLNRLFKKETGMTLKEYIVQQKMQEARSLLCTTNLPVSIIAAKVGYSNFAHFSVSYKKMYNCTPQEERQNAQQNG